MVPDAGGGKEQFLDWPQGVLIAPESDTYRHCCTLIGIVFPLTAAGLAEVENMTC
jgi:hypothetical protein